jgi:hypothetical protein
MLTLVTFASWPLRTITQTSDSIWLTLTFPPRHGDEISKPIDTRTRRMRRYENAWPSHPMIYRGVASKLQGVLFLGYGCDWRSAPLQRTIAASPMLPISASAGASKLQSHWTAVMGSAPPL